MGTATESPRAPRDANSVQSVERAIDVYLAIRDAQGPVSLSEVVSATGFTTSTVHRLLRALEKKDVVARGPGGTYLATTRLCPSSIHQTDFDELRITAAGVMRRLRERCGGETVGLYCRLNLTDMVCVESIPGTHEIRHVESTFVPLRISVSATSQTFLAETLERFGANRTRELIRGLPGVEPTEIDGVMRSVHNTRQHRYAVTTGRRIAGLTAIAVQIGDSAHLLGTLTLSGPAHRFTRGTAHSWLTEVAAAAERINASMVEADGRQPAERLEQSLRTFIAGR